MKYFNKVDAMPRSWFVSSYADEIEFISCDSCEEKRASSPDEIALYFLDFFDLSPQVEVVHT
ncbi:hypothetical protein D7X12_00185 [Corallococcus sicarius]|uniref:Uncharacterized protein n=1 Tax=Corallococcus sicarius TaxID=2316726 RepID=A0A3A8P7I5_9BACT|nr:hypothetical protein D7X12_00185 [Corallococcus sicarius]